MTGGEEYAFETMIAKLGKISAFLMKHGYRARAYNMIGIIDVLKAELREDAEKELK